MGWIVSSTTSALHGTRGPRSALRVKSQVRGIVSFVQLDGENVRCRILEPACEARESCGELDDFFSDGPLAVACLSMI